MNSFDFSDNNYDQYYVDVESRYPMFSDVYTGENDYIGNKLTNVKSTKTENESSAKKVQNTLKFPGNGQLKKVAESAVEKFITEPIDIQINQNTIIFLVFVMIIFLFSMCFKMMTEMRAEIKLLRKLMKKSIK